MTKKEALAILMEHALTFNSANSYPTRTLLLAVDKCNKLWRELENEE
jgi:hypothetical protein